MEVKREPGNTKALVAQEMLSRGFIPDLTSWAKPLIIEALRGALDRGHGRMPAAATCSPKPAHGKDHGRYQWLENPLAVWLGGYAGQTSHGGLKQANSSSASSSIRRRRLKGSIATTGELKLVCRTTVGPLTYSTRRLLIPASL